MSHKRTLVILSYLFTWLYVGLRIAALVVLALLATSEQEYPMSLIPIVLKVLVIYFIFSLAANLLFIVGIRKENEYYLLPYLYIKGIELFLAFVLLVGGSIYFKQVGDTSVLYYFIPAGIAITVIYGATWLCLILLCEKFENDQRETVINFENKTYFMYSSAS